VPSSGVVVDPLLTPHSDALSGCLFQLHLVQGDSGATAVVAAGGRWGRGWHGLQSGKGTTWTIVF
jgi:hypothetical protein